MGKKRKRNQNTYYEQDAPSPTPYPAHTDLKPPDIEGAHLYTNPNDIPWDLEPYWKHRHSMFSLYDHGIWTTDDSWFEVTHESIARKIADHVAAAKPAGKLIMLDCFAGIGGNAIAFALSGAYKRVYAIEKNLAALECARHNARIYGVHDQITFFHGDCFEILGLDENKQSGKIESLAQVVSKAGIIFGSPPWGGPGYKDAGNSFDLNGDTMPYTLDYMHSRFSKITKDMVLYLPRTSDLNQIADCVEGDEKAQIMHYCGKEEDPDSLKAIKMDQELPTINGSYAGDGAYNDEDLFGREDDQFDDLFGNGGDTFNDFEAGAPMEDPQSGYHDESMTPAPPASAEQAMVDADDAENDEMMKIMNEGMDGEAEGIDINALNDRPLDTSEEKADDAEDYGDIPDDDLADEEEPMGGPVQPASTNMLAGIEDMAREEDDDLFGDNEPADDLSVVAPLENGTGDLAHKHYGDSMVVDQPADVAEAGFLAQLGARDANMTEEDERNFRLQMALLRGEDQGPRRQYGTFEIDDMDAWLKIEFPDYDRNDDAPFWNKIMPGRPGTWKGKESSKKPRTIRPTKVSLDIEPDQKTLFTTPAAVAVPIGPRPDLVHFVTDKRDEQLETLSDSDSEDDLPNGLSIQDLEFMCTDFDTLSQLAEEDASIPEPRIVGEDTDMFDFENEFNDFERPIKKRRTGMSAHDIVTIHQFELPSFDNPEKITARLGREVVLDLNDSKLLVEEIDQETLRQRSRPGNKAGQLTSIKERLAHRFKTSNDAAYNLLQQNQKKVRGQLTNMTIDHSLPAIRLQYPYYQVKMSQRDMRNWHRKQIQFKNGFAFSKINKQKRKDFKSKSMREAYGKTRDLSVADNSYALLLEYSEEHPIMLSQTGMGNKVVNYYRKSDSNDNSRPKSEIGDTSVLMPEDKSPFNNFGHIDPGESTLALYNSMYRAPIFKQNQGSHQDFLIVREVTGMNGQIHYLRNIDYQYVVGQELPSVTVPGTHSRNVTTASKNRLKAISFRIARRKKSHRIRVEEVTRHFPDTNDMQNRQKMKEFMTFNKEQKEWEMKDGAGIPDEDEIQKTLKPEDICLLESMQVGSQYLRDSGYAEDDDGDDDKDDDDKKDLSTEQQLAPWKTTKNFIQATQGKAMLSLYGTGDPSGRGEAFSFIKTSMKGGFKAQGLSINEGVGKKGEGGHTYNVAKQQKLYDDAIRAIWERQKAVLSSQVEPDDEDEGVDGQLEQAERARGVRVTPMSGMQTPSGRRRDDETGTSFSKRSGTSQAQKFLKIRRKVYNAREDEWEYKEIVESDPQVIKLYLKRKEQMELQSTSFADLVPTGDPEVDARHKKRLEAELARLEQTKQKRPRKKKGQAAAADAGSPGAIAGAGSPDADGNDPPTPAPVSGGRQTQATARKCANCGRVGHIKTNKKLCPLLNGEIKPDSGGTMDAGAFMGAPPSMT
ncbi:hypothetical protein PMZ80_000118 [Knufia obscura]|uniref:Trimethylguanosine synthase n=1 Tax=Knufia obscura TaxID=1635080 RepID=A0ABR0S0E1_9EURO|nr:hypothetical protein PMZ80_000118 [Knufia obscura]